MSDFQNNGASNAPTPTVENKPSNKAAFAGLAGFVIFIGIIYLLVLGLSIGNVIRKNDEITAFAMLVSSVIGLIATFLAYKEKIVGILLAVIQVPIGAAIVYWLWWHGLMQDIFRFGSDKTFEMMDKFTTYSLNQSFVYSLFCGIPALLLLAILFVVLKRRRVLRSLNSQKIPIK